jgi:hypothetical protein
MNANGLNFFQAGGLYEKKNTLSFAPIQTKKRNVFRADGWPFAGTSLF